jgi:RNA 3'-terminal phosphate cyclase (ATP)
MIAIDGSQGEGGGQIVRSAVALAVVTARPVTITNVRAGRKKPGLMRQHLTAVNAAAEVCGARVQGAAIGSSCLAFQPGVVRPGEYTFRVGTAGSATLVLQTVLPALLIAEGPSKLTLEGGTHNPFAPPFDFLADAYLPLVNRMGPHVRAELLRAGFYPAGGGQFTVHIQPAPKLAGFELLERGEILQRRVVACVANLPAHIARRECDAIALKSGWDQSCFEVKEIRDSRGPGNVVMVRIESQHVTELFTGFGQRGVKAERVAGDVWKETREYLAAEVPVGPHLADQLLLPLGIAAHQGSRGTFLTTPLTRHSTTHVDVLQRFLNANIKVTENDRQGVHVDVSPR